MSGEVIAASTASRLPARMRSMSVCGAEAAFETAAAASNSTPSAAANPPLRALNLNNVAPEIGVVSPQTLAHVVEEAVGVLELAVDLVQDTLVEHVLRAAAMIG